MLSMRRWGGQSVGCRTEFGIRPPRVKGVIGRGRDVSVLFLFPLPYFPSFGRFFFRAHHF